MGNFQQECAFVSHSNYLAIYLGSLHFFLVFLEIYQSWLTMERKCKFTSCSRFCDTFTETYGSELLFIYLFFKFYLLILFMAVLGLRFCARAFSSCAKRGPLFIAVRGPLTIAAPLVAEHRLQTRRLSNCGSRAQLLCGMWNLPRPGLEPMSPASAGRFSTTAPPGKPWTLIFIFLAFHLFLPKFIQQYKRFYFISSVGSFSISVFGLISFFFPISWE